MKTLYEDKSTEQLLKDELPLDTQIDVLYEIMRNVIDDGSIKSKTIKFKLQKHIKSEDIYRRLYALNKIISNGKGIEIIPDENNIQEVLDSTNVWLTDEIAKRYVQNKIEAEVEKNLMEKQDKYIDEVRLGIIKKQKGPENAKTLKKYDDLKALDSRKLTKNIQSMLRPESFSEIVGQERAIKSLISKMASPYPQHIILYGPPGVGKTTAARLALEEAKKLSYTIYDKDAKFVEVDGTTLTMGSKRNNKSSFRISS